MTTRDSQDLRPERRQFLRFGRPLAILLVAIFCLGYSIGRHDRERGELAHAVEADTVHLLREPVERAGYYNEWWAYRGRRKGSAETEVTIIGEGKLVDFYGTLSPDAAARKLNWNSAVSHGESLDSAEIERLVPQQAIENSWAWDTAR